MKKIQRFFPVFFVCLLFVLCLCLCACHTEPDVDTPATQTDTDGEVTVRTFTYKTQLTPEERVAIAANDEAYLILVNKQNKIGADYVPLDLVTLDTAMTNGGKEIDLNGTAAAALCAMLREMKADGIDNVCVTSGYRSYTYQNWLFEYYITNETAAHPGWTREQAQELVLTYSAQPGTSEHHTGLCVDLWVDGMKELENYGSEGDFTNDVGFAETEAYRWLQKNAARFGFILRYPYGREDVTGYAYESWHWRFVGRDAACDIAEYSITLEEYLRDRE